MESTVKPSSPIFFVLDTYEGEKMVIDARNHVLYLWHKNKEDWEDWIAISPNENIFYLGLYFKGHISLSDLINLSDIKICKRRYENYKKFDDFEPFCLSEDHKKVMKNSFFKNKQYEDRVFLDDIDKISDKQKKDICDYYLFLLHSKEILVNLDNFLENASQEELDKAHWDACEASEIEIERCKRVFCVTHYYEGGQAIYLERDADLDPVRAAVYCQLKSEEWFGPGTILSNLGVATLLVHFYNCSEDRVIPVCQEVDLYFEREKMCEEKKYLDIMNDTSLHRNEIEMKLIMIPHLQVDDSERPKVDEERKLISSLLQEISKTHENFKKEEPHEKTIDKEVLVEGNWP